MGDSPRTAKVRRAWDRSAPGYDRQIGFLERRLFPAGREWLGSRAVGRVLDVGVGTGRNLRHYPAETRVTGIDLSPEMLAFARRRARQAAAVVELREGDAEHLPFAAGSFDSVVCALSLCAIPDPRTALSEMSRVLVPGGRLLLLDHVGSTWPPLFAVQWLVERVTIATAGEHFTRRQRPLVEAVGFRIVEADRSKAGVVERLHAVKANSTAPGVLS